MLSPTGLIVKLRELSETQPNVSDLVSGLGLSWRHLASEELLTFPFDRFLQTRRTSQSNSKRKSTQFFQIHLGLKLKSCGPNNEPIAFLGSCVWLYQAP